MTFFGGEFYIYNYDIHSATFVRMKARVYNLAEFI